MKDFIPKGTGNSRWMKSSIPTGTTWEEALAMLRAGTFPFDLNGVNSAGVAQMGTPNNKANLFSGETEAGYPSGTDTVNKAFEVLKKVVLYESVTTPLYTEHAVTLSSARDGDIVYLSEGGSMIPFYVASHAYESTLNGSGRVLLIRKDAYADRVWDAEDNSDYSISDIDAWCNSEYKNSLDPSIRNSIVDAKFYYRDPGFSGSKKQLTRSVFLPAVEELGRTVSGSNPIGSALPISSQLQVAYRNGQAVKQWTRLGSYGDYDNRTKAYYLPENTQSVISSVLTSGSHGFRTCFLLPSSKKLTWYTDAGGNAYPEQKYNTTSRLTDLLGNLIQIPSSQVK